MCTENETDLLTQKKKKAFSIYDQNVLNGFKTILKSQKYIVESI